MQITNKIIASLNPCKDRHDNYLKHYKNTCLTKAQFMGKKNITQEDKLWVAFRLMEPAQIRLAAADIAESVLHLYESKYPGDNRPRLAVEAAKSGNIDDGAAHAAHCAAYDAYSSDMAASSAANAASSAASRGCASASAFYATAAVFCATGAADGAFYTANAAARASQQKLIRKIILKHWKKI